jgi:hypothetical protein
MGAPALLLLSAALFVGEAWQLMRLAALLVVLVFRLAWLAVLILALPVRALARTGRRDARFLAVSLALLAVPTVALVPCRANAVSFGGDLDATCAAGQAALMSWTPDNIGAVLADMAALRQTEVSGAMQSDLAQLNSDAAAFSALHADDTRGTIALEQFITDNCP